MRELILKKYYSYQPHQLFPIDLVEEDIVNMTIKATAWAKDLIHSFDSEAWFDNEERIAEHVLKYWSQYK